MYSIKTLLLIEYKFSVIIIPMYSITITPFQPFTHTFALGNFILYIFLYNCFRYTEKNIFKIHNKLWDTLIMMWPKEKKSGFIITQTQNIVAIKRVDNHKLLKSSLVSLRNTVCCCIGVQN